MSGDCFNAQNKYYAGGGVVIGIVFVLVHPLAHEPFVLVLILVFVLVFLLLEARGAVELKQEGPLTFSFG